MTKKKVFMDYIIAKKGKLRKKFSTHSWDLLKNKNGWEIIIDSNPQIVSNNKVSTPPDNGEKKIVAATSQVVVNSIKPEEVQTTVNEKEIITSDEFANVISENKISKSDIKNKLDELKVQYKNNFNQHELISVLAKELNNDVVKLKTLFSIEENTNTSDL